MRNRLVMLALFVMAAAGFAAGLLVESRIERVQAQAGSAASFPALPGQKGGEDITGPYEAVADWPKPLTSLPGHEKWTWGAVEGIYAESPNRVFIVQRGEEPALKRPANTPLPAFGPSLSFPTGEVPFRNASQGPVASLPGGGAPGDKPEDAEKHWGGKVGVDARWEHELVVVDASGKISEDWTKWDNFFKRPHAVYINPYDAEKDIWVVDDYKEATFKFSHDGSKIVQTIGTPDVSGADDKHFNRPTFLAWLPESTMFVADGYNGTRVVKFDKNGKFLLAWGEKGNPHQRDAPRLFQRGPRHRCDPVTRHVYVWTAAITASRYSTRTASSSTSGRWTRYSSVNFLYISADRKLWAADDRDSRIVEYDLDGHLLYAWGTLSDSGGLVQHPRHERRSGRKFLYR